jgi:hypothetical protein
MGDGLFEGAPPQFGQLPVGCPSGTTEVCISVGSNPDSCHGSAMSFLPSQE